MCQVFSYIGKSAAHTGERASRKGYTNANISSTRQRSCRQFVTLQEWKLSFLRYLRSCKIKSPETPEGGGNASVTTLDLGKADKAE